MQKWLDFFIPFHDDCQWTRHEMTNHTVGQDADGYWAVCYGYVEWTMKATPDQLNLARVIYRDRLVPSGDSYVISRRRLDTLSGEPARQIPPDVRMPGSVLTYKDNS
jgi:hypothetical protein